MKTIEDIFKQEFKQNTIAQDENIFKMPLPQEVFSWNKIKTTVYAVKDIPSDNPFSGLNKSFVYELPKGKVAKRRVIDKVTRSFKKDSDGKFVYEEYKVPSGSIVVTSNRNLQLSYSEYVKPTPGYGYIDFVVSKGVKTYSYALPKSVIYRCHPTALVLSNAGLSKHSGSKLRCYNGERIRTWRCGTVGLFTIPFNPKKTYSNTVVLKTGFTLNYQEDIQKIEKYWESIGFIPMIDNCYLSTGKNLCVMSEPQGLIEYTYVDTVPMSTKEIFGDENQ